MKKVITVVIPTYNRVELTNDAIDSVFSISPELIDIVVIDDCGEQKFNYLKPANKHNIPVRNFRIDKNSGPGICRAVGLENSSSQLVIFLDSDDLIKDDWLDVVMSELVSIDPKDRAALFIVGRPLGMAKVYDLIWTTLNYLPHGIRLRCARLLVLMFNPFYTPTIVLSREICEFDDVLRYCEDYYTNGFAAFKATKLIMLPHVPCILGRKPGSLGGLSSARWKMFRGEMTVRFALFSSLKVPIYYKIFVPVGILYQIMRSILKLFIDALTYYRLRG